MRAARPALLPLLALPALLTLLLVSGCQREGGVIVVHATGQRPGLRQLRVSAVLANRQKMAAPVAFPDQPPAADLALPKTLALTTPAGLDSQVVLTVEALDDQGRVLETHSSAAIEIHPDQREDVELCFGPCVPADGDAGLAADAALLAADAAPLVADASPGVADAAPFVADAGPLVADAAPFVADAAPLVADAAPLVADAAPLVADAMPPIQDAAPFVADAMPATPDAAPLPVDAAPPRPLPPVRTGQLADLVLGQPGFTAVTGNPGGESAATLYTPSDLAMGSHLWVVDANNWRALGHALPGATGQAADLLLGQAQANLSVFDVSRVGLGLPVGIALDGTHVFVSDTHAHRVLIWNGLSSATAAPADVVLGQSGFTGMLPGAGAAGLDTPHGIWSDGHILIVADQGNSRVLIWRTVPTTSGRPADVVLGRVGFDLGRATPPASPPTASSLSAPTHVLFDGARLLVADTGNHRVLVWRGLPSVNGAPADYVIGQSDLSGGQRNAGGTTVGSAGFNGPTALVEADGALFVSDSGNQRVLVFAEVPAASGMPADAVLGQPDFSTAGVSATPRADRVGNPKGLAVSGDHLFVADALWNRVVRFTLAR